jgi:hypothetical protein
VAVTRLIRFAATVVCTKADQPAHLCEVGSVVQEAPLAARLEQAGALTRFEVK